MLRVSYIVIIISVVRRAELKVLSRAEPYAVQSRTQSRVERRIELK